MVGLLILAGVWWLMAWRWWSIQHAIFLRMKHIEMELGLYMTRYSHWLDNKYSGMLKEKLDRLVDGLGDEKEDPEELKDDLNELSKRKGWFCRRQKAACADTGKCSDYAGTGFYARG